MKRCYLLPCACPEVGVVILVREKTVRFESATVTRQMAGVSQAEDCWNIVTALSLLLTPFRSSVLEPDLFLNKTKIQ